MCGVDSGTSLRQEAREEMLAVVQVGGEGGSEQGDCGGGRSGFWMCFEGGAARICWSMRCGRGVKGRGGPWKEPSL